MDSHKADYKRAFDRLVGLKSEIETIQRTVEVSRLHMQSDFESWLSNCLALAAAEVGRGQPGPPPQQLPPQQLAPRPSASMPLPAASDSSGRGGGIAGAPLPSTGDAAADADVAAFYRASEELKRLRAAGAAGLSSALADAQRSQQAMQSARGSGRG